MYCLPLGYTTVFKRSACYPGDDEQTNKGTHQQKIRFNFYYYRIDIFILFLSNIDLTMYIIVRMMLSKQFSNMKMRKEYKIKNFYRIKIYYTISSTVIENQDTNCLTIWRANPEEAPEVGTCIDFIVLLCIAETTSF